MDITGLIKLKNPYLLNQIKWYNIYYALLICYIFLINYYIWINLIAEYVIKEFNKTQSIPVNAKDLSNLYIKIALDNLFIIKFKIKNNNIKFTIAKFVIINMTW